MKIGLREKLLGSFALVILVPSLAIGGASYVTAKSKVQNEITSSAQGNVNMLNDAITQEIQPEMKDVNFFADHFTATTPVSALMQELHSFQINHPELMNVYVGTSKGQFYLQPVQQLPAGYDPRKRPWYQDAVANPGTAEITEPYVDATSGKIVVTIAETTKDNSGVMAVDLDLNKLAQETKAVKIGQNGYAVIYDSQKKVIIDPKTKSGNNVPSWANTMFGSNAGNFASTISGSNTQVFYATNAVTGWKLGGILYSSEVATAASEILYTTLIVLLIAFLLAGGFVWFIYRSIMNPVRRLAGVVENIRQGDFTKRVEVTTHDELGKLSAGFNNMTDTLVEIITEFGDTAEQLASASEELSASAEETSHATEHIAVTVQDMAVGSDRQQTSIYESSSVVKNLSAGMQEIAVAADQVSSTAIEASSMASSGRQSIDSVIRGMNRIHESVSSLVEAVSRLGERSSQIGEIVEVISDIAGQTNLLSLNAAIEAARAGEQGRGFAVVADEVRKLAEQSTDSAKQIHELINTIQHDTTHAVGASVQTKDAVNDGIQAVQSAGESFSSILQAVNVVAEQIKQVSQSVGQMSSDSNEVVHSMHEIAELASRNALGTQDVSASAEQQLASMEEVTASASSLSHMAEQLQNIIQKFHI